MSWIGDPDTRFASSASTPNDWSALAVDLSSHGEDLTNVETNHAHSLDHAPTTGLIGDKCIEAMVEMSETSGTAVMVIKAALNPTENIVWDIRKAAGAAALRCLHGGSLAVQSAVPMMGATPQPYYVAWSDGANPNTTGPSDARISTLHIWRLDDGSIVEYVAATSTHAAPANNTDGLVVGAFTAAGGARWNQDGQSLSVIRISDRPRSRQEIEAWIPALLAEIPKQGHIWATKQRGRFFGIRPALEGYARLAVDRSQRGVDWDSGTYGIKKAAEAALFPTPAPWGFYCVADFDAASDEGTLYSYPGAGSNNQRLRVNAGVLEATIQSVAICSVALPSGAARWAVVWRVTDNPDSTGAADAYLTEIAAFSSLGCRRATATHGAGTMSGSADVFIANASTNAASVFEGTIIAAGITGRDPPPSLTEVVADFLEASEQQDDDAVLTLRQPVPLTRASGIGDVAEHAGPATAWAARAHRQAIRRHFSPMLNERFWRPELMATPASGVMSELQPYLVAAPGGGGYTFALFWMFERPIPPASNCAYVQAHLRQWHAGGGGSVEVSLRLYSMTRRPGEPGELDYRFVGSTRVAADTAHEGGTHVLQQILPLVRGPDDFTVLALAYSCEADALFEVSDLHVLPRFAPVVQGGNAPGGGIGGFGGG